MQEDGHASMILSGLVNEWHALTFLLNQTYILPRRGTFSSADTGKYHTKHDGISTGQYKVFLTCLAYKEIRAETQSDNQ